MNAVQLLTELVALGVKMQVDNGQLKVRAPKGVLNVNLRQALIDNKAELLAQFSGSKPDRVVSAVARTGRLPASTTQQRFLFLSSLYPEGVAYNLPNVHRLTGELDVAAFEQAVAAIVLRHEALRTTFSKIDADARQLICSSANHSYELVDVSGDANPVRSAMQQVQTDINQPFDLQSGPLLRVTLYRCGHTQSCVLLDVASRDQ